MSGTCFMIGMEVSIYRDRQVFTGEFTQQEQGSHGDARAQRTEVIRATRGEQQQRLLNERSSRKARQEAAGRGSNKSGVKGGYVRLKKKREEIAQSKDRKRKVKMRKLVRLQRHAD